MFVVLRLLIRSFKQSDGCFPGGASASQPVTSSDADQQGGRTPSEHQTVSCSEPRPAERHQRTSSYTSNWWWLLLMHLRFGSSQTTYLRYQTKGTIKARMTAKSWNHSKVNMTEQERPLKEEIQLEKWMSTQLSTDVIKNPKDRRHDSRYSNFTTKRHNSTQFFFFTKKKMSKKNLIFI